MEMIRNRKSFDIYSHVDTLRKVENFQDKYEFYDWTVDGVQSQVKGAMHKELKREFAVKIITKESVTGHDELYNLSNEFKLL